MENNFKKEYENQTQKSPYVFDKNGKITSNFSYTDNYVLWLENQLLDANNYTKDLIQEISPYKKAL